MVLGQSSLKKRIVTDLTSSNRSFTSLDIERIIERHISEETSLGLEMRPVYSEDSPLPDYLLSKLMVRELSLLVTGDSHLILDMSPSGLEEARELQQTWPLTAVFRLNGCEGKDQDREDLLTDQLTSYYRDLGILQVS